MITAEGITVSWWNGEKWIAIRRYVPDEEEKALKLYEDILTQRIGLSGQLTQDTPLRVVHWRKRVMSTRVLAKNGSWRLGRYEALVKTITVLRGPETVRERAELLLYV